jgi:hypothetical protein
MGGSGSGGHNRSSAGTTEQRRSIAISSLRKSGVLTNGWYGSLDWKRGSDLVADIRIRGGRDRIELFYSYRSDGDAWEPVEQPVSILWRPCPFGGERPLFLCPRCNQPVLQLFQSGPRFRCRHCCRLTYASRWEDEETRSLRRANRLRVQLGGDPGMDEPLPERPRHMHRRVYERMTAEIWEREVTADDYAAQTLMRFAGRLERMQRRSFWR